MERKSENGKLKEELLADSFAETNVDPVCIRLRKSFIRLSKRFGLYDEKTASVLGTPVGDVVKPEGEVSWDVILKVGEYFEDFPGRFVNAYKSIVEGIDHFSRRTEEAQSKAQRSPDSVSAHRPIIVKRGPGRHSGS